MLLYVLIYASVTDRCINLHTYYQLKGVVFVFVIAKHFVVVSVVFLVECDI